MATEQDKAATIRVEVVYVAPAGQALLSLDVPQGATLEDAVRRSGVLVQFPEIDLAVNKVGIFGKLCAADRVLRDGDRIEIYRPLVADPKEVRRRLAAEGRTMGKKRRS